MNPPDYRRLGEIGAQAAYTSAKSQGKKFAWLMTVHDGLEGTQIGFAAWKGDEPARTAYTRAVIEEYQRITREQAGEGMPSVEECIQVWHQSAGINQGPSAVREHMLSAFARKMEDVAKLPERWLNGKTWTNEARDMLKACSLELAATLPPPATRPPAPTAEDVSRAEFEAWWKQNNADEGFTCGEQAAAWSAWQAARASKEAK